jgi:uridine kinase
MSKPYIVGLAGGSGSGKSSFIRDLASALSDLPTALVLQDNYYRKREEQQADGNGKPNFDLPGAIDHLTLERDISMLKKGLSISKEEYTFNHPDRKPQWITTYSAPIIFVEGIFVFHFSEISSLFDLRVFLDAEPSVMLERRLKRDAAERGYPMEDVLYQWHHHVMPAYHQFLEPFKPAAHIVVNNNENYLKGLEILTHHLRAVVGATRVESC